MIFRNTGFHLTHQVGTHIGCLGIDTTTHTGKKCNRGGTEAESCNDGDHQVHICMAIHPDHLTVDQKERTQTQYTESDNAEPHN